MSNSKCGTGNVFTLCCESDLKFAITGNAESGVDITIDANIPVMNPLTETSCWFSSVSVLARGSIDATVFDLQRFVKWFCLPHLSHVRP